MKFACCTWALAGPEATILDQLAQLGFAWIDVRAIDFTADTSRARIAAHGLQLSCVGLSFALPPGVSLDSPDSAIQASALAHTRKGLQHAAHLGADTTYIIPGLATDPLALTRYADAVTTLADQAAILGIKLCIEHFPKRALPTVAATLAYLRSINHPNLYLLFDIVMPRWPKKSRSPPFVRLGTGWVMFIWMIMMGKATCIGRCWTAC